MNKLSRFAPETSPAPASNDSLHYPTPASAWQYPPSANGKLLLGACLTARRLQVALCELQERRPIQGIRMAAGMITKCHLTQGQRPIRRRHLRRPKVLL